ncbi:MAG TPA: putative Ig domain-containing protein, partial [Acidimicrobiales bacterium]|nr:putative Ig domain-containing protein [Acidimicrobiales bacterium]
MAGLAALSLVASAAVVGLTAGSAAAAGTTFYVSTGGSDTNPCTEASPCASISHAVSLAAAGDTISVGQGTFDDHVDVATNLTIVGAGTGLTIVNGQLSGTVFTIAAGATVSISDLTITGGQGVNGGGVNDAGTLDLERVSVSINSAVGPVGSMTEGQGGGIYASGSLIAQDSTFFSDQATNAGGAVASAPVSGRSIILLRDAVWQNTVTSADSALLGGGGVYVGIDALADLEYDTLAENQVLGSLGAGGAIQASESHGAFLLGDTIAGNVAPSGGGWNGVGGSAGSSIFAANQGGNCDQTLGDNGYNLEDDAAGQCGFSAGAHDVVGVSPDLGPLQGNGGPTFTEAIGDTSVAYDVVAASSGDCTGTDQRGVALLQPGATSCDIGAYQLASAPPLSVTTTSLPAGQVGASYSASLAATGGTMPYTWAVTTGSLPPGLSLDASTGAITGKPTGASATTDFSVTVTDSTSPTAKSASAALSVTVAPGPGVSLDIVYKLDRSWRSGFEAELDITNTSSAPLGSSASPWVLGFSLPRTTRISSLWDATLVSSSPGDYLA